MYIDFEDIIGKMAADFNQSQTGITIQSYIFTLVDVIAWETPLTWFYTLHRNFRFRYFERGIAV